MIDEFMVMVMVMGIGQKWAIHGVFGDWSLDLSGPKRSFAFGMISLLHTYMYVTRRMNAYIATVLGSFQSRHFQVRWFRNPARVRQNFLIRK